MGCVIPKDRDTPPAKIVIVIVAWKDTDDVRDRMRNGT